MRDLLCVQIPLLFVTRTVRKLNVEIAVVETSFTNPDVYESDKQDPDPDPHQGAADPQQWWKH